MNLKGFIRQADHNDYFILDSALPKVYGGFGTQLTAYGFDLSLDFGYSIGGKVYDGQYALFMGNPTSGSKGYNWHADILKHGLPKNPPAPYRVCSTATSTPLRHPTVSSKAPTT